jgi:RimJ/RimL family protein N-acetyltransferase
MSDEVLLRDVVEADLEVFFQAEQDPEAFRRSRFPPRDRERFMTHWRTRVLGDPGVFVKTVTVDGEPAGSVVAWWEEERRFVGYYFARRFWGRGVGTRAVAMFVEREQHRPLYADPHAGNTGSVRVLERCGFRRESTVRYGDEEHVMLVLP